MLPLQKPKINVCLNMSLILNLSLKVLWTRVIGEHNSISTKLSLDVDGWTINKQRSLFSFIYFKYKQHRIWRYLCFTTIALWLYVQRSLSRESSRWPRCWRNIYRDLHLNKVLTWIQIFPELMAKPYMTVNIYKIKQNEKDVTYWRNEVSIYNYLKHDLRCVISCSRIKIL